KSLPLGVQAIVQRPRSENLVVHAQRLGDAVDVVFDGSNAALDIAVAPVRECERDAHRHAVRRRERVPPKSLLGSEIAVLAGAHLRGLERGPVLAALGIWE